MTRVPILLCQSVILAKSHNYCVKIADFLIKSVRNYTTFFKMRNFQILSNYAKKSDFQKFSYASL